MTIFSLPLSPLFLSFFSFFFFFLLPIAGVTLTIGDPSDDDAQTLLQWWPTKHSQSPAYSCCGGGGVSPPTPPFFLKSFKRALGCHEATSLHGTHHRKRKKKITLHHKPLITSHWSRGGRRRILRQGVINAPVLGPQLVPCGPFKRPRQLGRLARVGGAVPQLCHHLALVVYK